VAGSRSPFLVRRPPALAVFLVFLLTAGRESAKPAPPSARAEPVRPSILLVTLDTTRADAIGPEARGCETPAFNALAARGLRFRRAYATVPETLPSHASIMTGLYPAGHGVHENARYLPRSSVSPSGCGRLDIAPPHSFPPSFSRGDSGWRGVRPL
jgi:predicted AlkP superfamily pyrophosphatase or phosphodiesterase